MKPDELESWRGSGSVRTQRYQQPDRLVGRLRVVMGLSDPASWMKQKRAPDDARLVRWKCSVRSQLRFRRSPEPLSQGLSQRTRRKSTGYLLKLYPGIFSSINSMIDKNIAKGLVFTKSLGYGDNFKAIFHKDGFPGILFITRHVVN